MACPRRPNQSRGPRSDLLRSDAAFPICDSEALECVAGSEDAECGSGVCEATSGECVAESAIVYVDDDGNDDDAGYSTEEACTSAGARVLAKCRYLAASGTSPGQLKHSMEEGLGCRNGGILNRLTSP